MSQSRLRCQQCARNHFGNLWHDGVAEGAQAVHPGGNPISHSTQSGFNRPPSMSFN